MSAFDSPQRLGVGLGECRVTADPLTILVAIGLGSCIGVAAYEPRRGIGGMAHVVLPDGSLQDASRGPAYYADPGVGELLSMMEAAGAARAGIEVRIAGGAAVLGGSADAFHIGQRNAVAVKRALEKRGLPLLGEDVGGTSSRTVELAVGTGAVTVKSGDRSWPLSARPEALAAPTAAVRSTPAAPAIDRSAMPPPERPTALSNGPLFLVVDDSAFVRTRCRALLEANGCRVREAANGLEAIEAYKLQRPNAVLMDITMPLLDGLSALREIKGFDPHVRMAMMTATGQQAAIVNALRAGAMDFLPKPFEPDQFLRVTGKLTG